MLDEPTRVLVSEEVARDFFLTRLIAPHVATQAIPGQFVEVQVGEEVAPLLRMPLSIGAVEPAEGTIDLLYERIGPKSRALSRLPVGSELRCLGPLGQGFREPPVGHEALLVGGGIGLPPLLFWGSRLRAQGRGVVLLAGARTAAKHLPDPLLTPAAQRVLRATDDGSMGHDGLVTDLLEEELKNGVDYAVYTCGPHGMMAAVAELCLKRDVACQVSLEEYMACGIGICVGCAVEVISEYGDTESDYTRYSRVCVDGPVFDARRIRWEER